MEKSYPVQAGPKEAAASALSGEERVEGVQSLVSPLNGESPIHYGENAVDLLPDLVRSLRPDKVFVISDRKVFQLYGSFLLHRFDQGEAPEVILIPSGELEKNLENLTWVCQELFDRGATKSSLVINFGGGVVLNLGGMAASLVYRGIRFLHVPTTLMAQSDVIVSNKQGINFAGGKNRLGLFSTAVASIADPRFFGTEPLRQIKAALVEWCKNALLLGGMHYERALAYFEQGDGFSTHRLRTMVGHSLEQKFAIAELDPGERKYGLILEYGHTVGHALEFLAQGRLLHGEAVYHGLRVAGRLSHAMGLLPADELAKQEKLLDHLHCMPSIPPEFSVAQILQGVRKDNKKENKGHSFVLLKAIGEPHRHGESVMIPVQEETLQQVLLDYRDSLL